MTVGVDGGQWQATTWVMMWVMMWVMGRMVAMTPGTIPAQGMARTPAGREGGGLLAEDVVAAVTAATAAAAACCRGHLLFIVKIFLCSIFMMCGGIGEVTPPLTLSSCLRYVVVLSGGDGNCPQKMWYVNTKNYLAKKHGNQS
jgi:hypothetical protein